MWSGFKGHGSDVIIHPLVLLRHEKYLPRSVIITVALLWTPSYTRLATPLQSTVLFPSKDAAALHLCVIIGSSAYEVWLNENRRALHHERFLYQLHKRRAPCHLTFVTSPRWYHVNLSLCRSMLSCIFTCILCILYMCYEPCESFHALWSGGPAAFPTHGVQKWSSIFRVWSSVWAAVQHNAIMKPQEPTFLCVPVPSVWSRPTAVPSPCDFNLRSRP